MSEVPIAPFLRFLSAGPEHSISSGRSDEAGGVWSQSVEAACHDATSPHYHCLCSTTETQPTGRWEAAGVGGQGRGRSELWDLPAGGKLGILPTRNRP